ncbi:hypothetical protein P691DRAFT_803990 [Macrolepiota fuliginosa MF-IS2]|uniref:BZIP domain-containing protein n=1 Tax=Macrolepiota fuliginosa MF-IS2 TaxID=1400762 RepID=A0A9P5X8C3_9AGAR|nr:hypothetical protein P691DRAFT_803990 [Macrolepiota fuliginosa MF-IS2]
MRLRDDPPPITPPTRSTRKRKTPPAAGDQVQVQPPPPPPPQQPMQHVLPPPHALMHPLQGPLPPGYPYATPADYTPGGLPPGAIPPHPNMAQQPQPQQPSSQAGSTGRALSNSKRAEQNRKAQRAFRERRDQHVKALESRSQLLDAALASADEANRRWEECRALVDQLRIENAALRAALSAQHPMIPPSALPSVAPATGVNGAAGNPTASAPMAEEEKKLEGNAESTKEGEEASAVEKKD